MVISWLTKYTINPLIKLLFIFVTCIIYCAYVGFTSGHGHHTPATVTRLGPILIEECNKEEDCGLRTKRQDEEKEENVIHGKDDEEVESVTHGGDDGQESVTHGADEGEEQITHGGDEEEQHVTHGGVGVTQISQVTRNLKI